MELTTKDHITSVVLFWLRKDKGRLKAEDVTILLVRSVIVTVYMIRMAILQFKSTFTCKNTPPNFTWVKLE